MNPHRRHCFSAMSREDLLRVAAEGEEGPFLELIKQHVSSATKRKSLETIRVGYAPVFGKERLFKSPRPSLESRAQCNRDGVLFYEGNTKSLCRHVQRSYRS